MPTKVFVTVDDEPVYSNEAQTSFTITPDAEHHQLAQYSYQGTLDDEGIDTFMKRIHEQIGKKVFIE